MASRRNRSKRRKKRRVRKTRLLILVAILIILIIAIFKGISGVSSLIKNISEKKSVEIQTETNLKQFNLEEESSQNIEKKYTILIDPGHGGNDKGTQSTDGKINEKDVTLTLAKMVASKLSKQNDIQVTLSRTDDKYVALGDRAIKANNENVDLLVSIHLNAEYGGTSAYGLETYYKKGATDGSDKLADAVQKSIISYIDVRDRGIREDNFQVLRESSMPAILIECGFLTNAEESKKLIDPQYQENLTEGIAQGILSYLDNNKN